MDKNKGNGPSKFAVPPFASDDEIWIKILEVLTPSEQLEASRSKSEFNDPYMGCLLYTSPSPRDRQKSRMPSSA